MTVCRVRPFAWLLLSVLLLPALPGTGCRREATPSAGRTAPIPNSPALYGAPSGQPATAVTRARPDATKNSAWETAPFFILESELSPATLVHSSKKYLGLFTGLTSPGPGGPTYVAWSTRNGPRSFKRGEKLDVAQMDENWILVWWAGAEGWTNWDCPWAVYLQHKPRLMTLDADGLHLEFPTVAGDVVLMPLYGFEKLPTKELDYRKAHGLPARKPPLESWKWAAGLMRDPLMRLRYWAAATREMPLYCEESISVDRAKDSVTFRSRFRWHSIDDDWKTRHLKLAALSPVLAHTVKEEGFPVTISGNWSDLDLATPAGPYCAVPDTDSFEATLSVLQYVNETEITELPNTQTNAPTSVALALDKLPGNRGQLFTYSGPNPFDLESRDLDAWSAKALPYYDDVTRTNILASLRAHFRDEVLNTNRFTAREFPEGSGRLRLFVDEPQRISRQPSGDAFALNAALLESLWAYAHFSGDWDLIRERWPMVKQLFVAPGSIRWAGFGQDAVVEMGHEAAPCAAFARLAYQAGDLDAYNYGCSIFARELVHLFLKQRGVDYFRRRQPWHLMESMGDDVFLTELRHDGTGWEIEGPTFPAGRDDRRFDKRWRQFNDFDVARFYREYLKDDVRRELNWFQSRPEASYDPRSLPSWVPLRSLLLNESPRELAAMANPDSVLGRPAAVLATCLSILRTSHPTRYQRLIPGGPPSPFVAGLEREVAGPNAPLLTSVEPAAEDSAIATTNAAWPRLTWRSWKTPSGASWSFGHVTPVREGSPRKLEIVPLNWNTRVLMVDPP